MKIHEVKTYSFGELAKDVQAKVIDDNRNFNTDDDYWFEWIVDDEKEALDKEGYTDAEIFFSGFSSQGDGASFTCHVDLEKWLANSKLKTKYKSIIDKADYEIEKGGNYEHEYTMGIDLTGYYDMDEKQEKLANELADIILEDAREHARAIYHRLENEYNEYYEQASDEAVIDALERNDDEFTADGKIFFERS